MVSNTITRYGKQYKLYSDTPLRKSQYDNLKMEWKDIRTFISIPAGSTYSPRIGTTRWYWVYYRNTSAANRAIRHAKQGVPFHVRLRDAHKYKEDTGYFVPDW